MSKQNQPSLLDRPEITALLFHPRKDPLDQLPPGASELFTPVDEGISLNSRLYAGDAGRPHILFFHGNGEIAADYDDIGPIYQQFGLNLLVSDYRGYGKSTGRPDVSSMLQDAHAVFDHIRRWMHRNERTGPLWVMGRSLGSAPALELAAHYPDDCQGLIIESGFAYTLDLLAHIGLDTRGWQDNAKAGSADINRINIDKIARYAGPTLIIHAQQDGIIPAAHGKALYQASPAPVKNIRIIEGADHNTIFLIAGKTYFSLIREFTDQASATART